MITSFFKKVAQPPPGPDETPAVDRKSELLRAETATKNNNLVSPYFTKRKAEADTPAAEKPIADSPSDDSGAVLDQLVAPVAKKAKSDPVPEPAEACAQPCVPAEPPAEAYAQPCVPAEPHVTEDSHYTFSAGAGYEYGCRCSASGEDQDRVVSKWISDFYGNSEQSATLYCGLDCEWCPPWWRGNQPERVATIQLYSPWAGVLLYSTGSYDVHELPPDLAKLLADERVVKLGCNVRGDGIRLVRDFANVGSVASLHDIAGKKHLKLEALVAKCCPPAMHVDKSADSNKVRLGNWAAWPLTREQTEYAALDAVLSFWAFGFGHGLVWGLQRDKLLQGFAPKLELQSATPEDAGDTATDSTAAEASSRANANFFVMHRNKSIVPPNLGLKEHPPGPADALKKVCVCISGVLDSISRQDMETYVTSHGGKVAKAITKKVTHLLNDHGEIGPSKKAKCKKLRVPIVSEDVIFDIVRSAASCQ